MDLVISKENDDISPKWLSKMLAERDLCPPLQMSESGMPDSDQLAVGSENSGHEGLGEIVGSPEVGINEILW